ncbi:MAG: antibiotic biosynthesis monooxygenase [Actinobacteria bacterium]|nr:antibiotic biosynthesis monooxygenase [Actinomycetota bacterium]
MPVLSYLRFALAAGADREAFERDLAAIRDLARLQPGHRWDEVGRDPWDERKYLVVTEWDEVDEVRAFEHHPEHEAIIRRWEGSYSEDFQHRRFVPWVRPDDREEAPRS